MVKREWGTSLALAQEGEVHKTLGMHRTGVENPGDDLTVGGGQVAESGSERKHHWCWGVMRAGGLDAHVEAGQRLACSS